MGKLGWFFAVMLGVTMGFLLLSGSVLVWFADPMEHLATSAGINLLNSEADKLSNEDAADLARLVASGAVLPAEAILEHVAEFYGHIINILIGGWAGLGIIAFMYIKVQSSDAAMESAKDAVTDYFQHKEYLDQAEQAFEKAFENFIDSRLDDVDTAIQRLGTVEEHIEDLKTAKRATEKSLENLEDRVAQLDREEDTGEELNIGTPLPEQKRETD